MGASLFREPEAFLQFLMFTEWSDQDKTEQIDEKVAEIRNGGIARGSPRASAGSRNAPAPKIMTQMRRVPAARASGDSGIDFIPDADGSARDTSRAPGALARRSSDISFGERRNRDVGDENKLPRGRSAEIPLGERFGSAREPESLTRGKSAEIPLDERFESAQKEREKKPTPGRSADIPYRERRGGRER